MKLNNGKYKILSPEGFVDFLGIQKLRKKTREIIFNNNISLRGSENHIIYDIENNEIKLKELSIGDKIKSPEGFLIVQDIIDHDYESDVFDIIDSGELHLYYTNDIISHNCNFLGSGDNVFDSDLIQNIAKNMLREPQAKLMGGSLWIFKEPVNGHRYVMGIDVSRGDSEDFSSIEIIDFDESEQVLEYVGKIPPDVLAEIAYKWGGMYNAYCVVDLTGGMGVSTARKLQEMNYPHGYYVDGIDTQNKWKYDPKANEKIPGINFNSKRVQIIAAFEEAVRHGFKIYSSRLYNEMNTFIYINGRPDHQKGHHDDCIMGISMALYVAEKSFQSLEKVTNHTKAMLNSWATHATENKNASDFFNPMVPQMGRQQPAWNQGPTKQDYQKYGWLFGAR